MTVGLVVEIIGDAAKLESSLAGAKGQAGGFGAMLGGSALKVAAFAGVAGIAAGAIAEMTSAAAEDKAEQERLMAAIDAAGAATGNYVEQVDAAIAAGQDKAFSDTQTREALMSLVTATGDVTTATAELTTAQDLARFANVDLAVAADAVAKAHAGQDGALRKLMPGLEKGATASDTLAEASKRAAGQADKYASSAQGMQDRAGDAFGELTETIGEIFLPVLEEILPVLIPILKQFAQLVKMILPLLIPLVKILAKELSLFVTVISTVVGWVIKLVKWLGDAADAIGDFLGSINVLQGIKLPSLPFLSSAPAGTAAASVGARGAPSTMAGTVAPVTVNVYTTADGIEAEAAVVRALRRVTRLNGGVVPAVGWTSSG